MGDFLIRTIDLNLGLKDSLENVITLLFFLYVLYMVTIKVLSQSAKQSSRELKYFCNTQLFQFSCAVLAL